MHAIIAYLPLPIWLLQIDFFFRVVFNTNQLGKSKNRTEYDVFTEKA